MKDDVRKNRAVALKVKCFVCLTEEPLPTAEDHHRTPRAFGGTDDESNRVWLCASCHARLHRVQGFLLKGEAASAYDLCQSIFPTDGRARGQLWTLANEAADAEREVKESFGSHRTHQKVTLTIDADTWSVIKAQAKDRKMSASQYAASLLRRAASGE